MNLAEKYQSRCKSIIRMKHMSVNSFCSMVEQSDSFLSRWQVLNTLTSENPRIIYMSEIARVLGVKLERLLFADDIRDVIGEEDE